MRDAKDIDIFEAAKIANVIIMTKDIRSILKIAGSPIGADDVLIAATALSHHHIVVTSNVREFQRVPNLQIENWRVCQ
ncbi:hypothetical protein NIES73_14600 [Sphaerospermopsis kisseleviana NIES-73]|nr:hypothetical protein NIES73_14600 [Sphaerospermopsis kisseleviana NIES-73]